MKKTRRKQSQKSLNELMIPCKTNRIRSLLVKYFNLKSAFPYFVTAGRYVARKISAVFSKSSDKAQSQEATEESSSEPRSLKFSSAAVSSETETSAHQWKDSTEYANGSNIRHVNGEGVTT